MRWKQVSKGNAYSPRIGRLNHTSGNYPTTNPIATDSLPQPRWTWAPRRACHSSAERADFITAPMPAKSIEASNGAGKSRASQVSRFGADCVCHESAVPGGRITGKRLSQLDGMVR